LKDQFTGAWKSYLPALTNPGVTPLQPAEIEGSGQSPAVTKEDNVTGDNELKAAKNLDCNDVTAESTPLISAEAMQQQMREQDDKIARQK